MTSVNPYLKRRELFVLALESTRGTASTGTRYTFPWLTKGITTMPGILENESGNGNDYRVNDSAIDVNHAEGPLGGKVTETNIAILERLMMTKVTTTDNEDGTYTHDFEYDSTVEPATATGWDVRPSTTRRYTALTPENLDIEVEAGENGGWLTASTALKGWKHTDVTPITPTDTGDDKEYTSRMVKVFLADDVAGLADETNSRVKARRIKISREQSKAADHSVGDGDTPEFDKGPFEAKGEMVVKYRKTDFEEDYFANAVHAMKVVVQNGDTKIEYTGTKVRFRELTDSDDRDTVVTQTISFYFESDHNNGGHAIKSSVTNTMEAI